MKVPGAPWGWRCGLGADTIGSGETAWTLLVIVLPQGCGGVHFPLKIVESHVPLGVQNWAAVLVEEGEYLHSGGCGTRRDHHRGNPDSS